MESRSGKTILLESTETGHHKVQQSLSCANSQLDANGSQTKVSVRTVLWDDDDCLTQADQGNGIMKRGVFFRHTQKNTPLFEFSRPLLIQALACFFRFALSPYTSISILRNPNDQRTRWLQCAQIHKARHFFHV